MEFAIYPLFLKNSRSRKPKPTPVTKSQFSNLIEGGDINARFGTPRSGPGIHTATEKEYCQFCQAVRWVPLFLTQKKSSFVIFVSRHAV